MENQKFKNFPSIMKKTTDLVPYARNSRIHSPPQIEQICNSIKEFGFTNPIICDESGGIIAGHGRVMAAKRLKIKEVPCVVVSGWSEAQKKAYVIADNKLALNAEWDEEMLALEFAELESLDFDLSLTGFDLSDVGNFIRNNEQSENEDDAPEPEEKTVTSSGDVWILGNHRVMCGDSLKHDDVFKLMGGQLMANLWLTDPPYNVSYEGKTKEALKIQNDKMADEDFRKFLKSAFLTAKNFLKDGGVFYIWHADLEGYNFRGACFDAELKVRQCLVWLKNSMVLGRQDYQWKHEPCLYGWKDGAAHYWGNDRKQTTILEFDKPHRNGEHPTMKPVALFEYQVLNNTKEGEIVLDTFGGSGTTAIACEKTNRYARLMELDPKYVDVIVKRWQNFTNKQAVLESTGESFNDKMAKITEAN